MIECQTGKATLFKYSRPEEEVTNESTTTGGIFFLLLAAKVRSSCEEGPGQSALQSAYHNPKLDVNELKQTEIS